MQEMQETWVQSLGQEDALEEEMATHSSILAWRTPWTADCQALLSMKFSKQEYFSGLPFPTPRDLPDTSMEPISPAVQADSLPLSHLEAFLN